MPKDRYSNDHTIEVVGGTQTVIIKDNLTVEDNLTVGGDIVSTGVLRTDSGDLNVPGDLSVDGHIDVTTYVDASDYSYNTTKQVVKWIPISVLANAINCVSYSGMDSHAVTNAVDGITNYQTITIGHSTVPTWDLYINIDDLLPDECTVEQVIVLCENITASAVGTIDYQADIESFPAPGVSTTVSVIGSGTTTMLSTLSFRTKLLFDVSTSVIENDSASGGYCVRLKFSQTDPTIANTLIIHKIGLKLNIDTVSQGLGIQ